MTACLNLPLRERYALRRTAAHNVLNFDRSGRNAHHFVAAVHNLALACNENIVPLGKENLFRFALLAGETKKFQRNWWSCRYGRRLPDFGIVWPDRSRSQWRGNHRIRLRYKNVPSRTFVLDLLGGCQLREVKSRVEALRTTFLFRRGRVGTAP